LTKPLRICEFRFDFDGHAALKSQRLVKWKTIRGGTTAKDTLLYLNAFPVEVFVLRLFEF